MEVDLVEDIRAETLEIHVHFRALFYYFLVGLMKRADLESDLCV